MRLRDRQAPARQGRTCAFGPDARIRHRRAFEKVYGQGRKSNGRFITLFLLPNGLDRSRLGIAATRKLGKSVQRNLARRRVREVFRTGRPLDPIDVVVVPRREFFDASYAALAAEFHRLLGQLRAGGGRQSRPRAKSR